MRDHRGTTIGKNFTVKRLHMLRKKLSVFVACCYLVAMHMYHGKSHAATATEYAPFMGDPVIIGKHNPGKYVSLIDFRADKMLSRESIQSQTVKGSILFELQKDHQITFCVNVKEKQNVSESKYISLDGKHHTYANENNWRMKGSGHWSAQDKGIRITLDKGDNHGCDGQNKNTGEAINLVMDCVLLKQNNHLPVDALACRMIQNHSGLEKLAINPLDMPGAGPYSLQTVKDRMKKKPTLPGERWIFAGQQPGIEITSRKGIHGKAEVKFSKCSAE